MAPPKTLALVGVIVALVFGVRFGVLPRVLHVDTPSMPMGFYWVTSAPVATIDRGEVVSACPPVQFAQWAHSARLLGEGTCDGIEPVVKRVVAVGGDRVRIDAQGVFVNGRYQVGSQPRRLYHGKPVPHVPFGDRVLKPGEVLLLGDRRSESWDGRFFGPTDHVLGRAALVVPTGG